MQNYAVAQKPRPFAMNGLPLLLNYTKIMLSSYSVTMVKEINKRHIFVGER
jgi:hypothetical protein